MKYKPVLQPWPHPSWASAAPLMPAARTPPSPLPPSCFPGQVFPAHPAHKFEFQIFTKDQSERSVCFSFFSLIFEFVWCCFFWSVDLVEIFILSHRLATLIDGCNFSEDQIRAVDWRPSANSTIAFLEWQLWVTRSTYMPNCGLKVKKPMLILTFGITMIPSGIPY